MRLVDNERVVLIQKPVGLHLRQQDPVGHDFYVAIRPGVIGEAHLEADRAPRLALQLLRDARRHRARRDAPRLRMPDQSRHPASQVETYFRQLRGLARTGLAANHHHLMLRNRRCDFLAPLIDRQIIGKLRLGRIRRAPLALGNRVAQLRFELRQFRTHITRAPRTLLKLAQPPLQPIAVFQHASC